MELNEQYLNFKKLKKKNKQVKEIKFDDFRKHNTILNSELSDNQDLSNKEQFNISLYDETEDQQSISRNKTPQSSQKKEVVRLEYDPENSLSYISNRKSLSKRLMLVPPRLFESQNGQVYKSPFKISKDSNFEISENPNFNFSNSESDLSSSKFPIEKRNFKKNIEELESDKEVRKRGKILPQNQNYEVIQNMTYFKKKTGDLETINKIERNLEVDVSIPKFSFTNEEKLFGQSEILSDFHDLKENFKNILSKYQQNPTGKFFNVDYDDFQKNK